MKKITFFMCCFVAFSVSVTSTVMAQIIQTPEFPNKIMYVNTDGSLAPLDKTMMEMKANASAMKALAGKAKMYYSAKGNTSSIVHSGKRSDSYVLKIGAGIDPENYVELFKFEEIKKNERRFTTAQLSATSSDPRTEDKSIAIDSKKLSDGVYVYSTKNDLEAGEYFFLIKGGYLGATTSAEQMNGETITAFCFKVE